MNGSITRVSLGNVASLGDLYDARTDNFCGLSILKRAPPSTALKRDDNYFSDIQITHVDNYVEKFSKFDVSAELQVSVLAGLLKLEGSGRYLNEEKTSKRSVKSTLIYNIRTTEEHINIYDEVLKPAFALEAVKTEIATHMVQGITWGANCVITSEYMNSEEQHTTVIEGKLSAQLKKLSLSISGKAGVDFNERFDNNENNLTIRIFGDVLPKNEDLPTTFDGALQLMRQVRTLIKDCNQGKGMPMKYHLIPITIIKRYLNFDIKAEFILKSIASESLVRIVKAFERMAEAKQTYNDFKADVLQNKFAVPQEEMLKVLSFAEKFEVQESTLRSKLADLITSLRSNKGNITDLEAFLAELESSCCSLTSVNRALINMSDVLTRVNFAKNVLKMGAKYIGLGSSLDEELIGIFPDSKNLVLYFNTHSRYTNLTKWNENQQLFFQEIQKNVTTARYFVVDCDIHPQLFPETGVCIKCIENMKVTCSDLLEYQKISKQIPIARSTSQLEKISCKPNNRVNLNIPCTGTDCSTDTIYTWRCQKCNMNLEYGFDDYFYCHCGRGLVVSFEFKCPHLNHGVGFESHEKTYLDNLLKNLGPLKELNILILGETGVGKSTWINGFYNFMKFESLMNAEKHDLCTIIPTKFIICDENLEQISVSTGVDENEVHCDRQSATQESKVYTFVVGTGMIRLIDTPGIGDSRGTAKDEENLENILSTISNLEELHGICVFLKPKNSRLDLMFRFYINELLTYLHRNASQNIVFCFTNTRGTLYHPGETYPLLKSLLEGIKYTKISISDHTMYCYDSEAFRFLAAIKNKDRPVKFSENEKQNFAKSWEQSCKETRRMLSHIAALTPHKIQSTINFNQAKNLILPLARPLAEISRDIKKYKNAVSDNFKVFYRAEASLKHLKLSELKKIKSKQEFLATKKFEELDEESKEIQLSSIQFAEFLRKNSITAYNTAALEYMDHLLQQEKQKIASGGDKSTYDYLLTSQDRNHMNNRYNF